MTNAELISKIKVEIERLRDEYADIAIDSRYGTVNANHVVADLEQLLSSLSTLESEKPMNQEDELNGEIKKFVAEYDYERSNDIVLIAIVARHFAEWGAERQKDKDARDMYMSDNRHFEKVYQLGRTDMREQMLKEAVEVRVQTSPLNGPLGISAYCCNFPSNHPFYHCKEGDKVRIIIIKDDGKSD